VSPLARSSLVVCVGVTSLVGIIGLAVSGEQLDVDWLLVELTMYLVAAVTIIRVPENRVSWVLLAIAIGFTLGNFTWLPGGVGLALNFIGIFGFILPGNGVLLPLWFPTGSPPSRRWRWVEALTWVAVSGLFVSQLIGIVLGQINDDIEGCTSAGSCLEIASVVLTLVAMGAGVTALIVRWIRSGGIERQQMKAVVFAFSVFAVGTAIEFGIQQDHPVGQVLMIGGGLLIPIAIGMAIVRYRLYEIDRIVSRTVTYVTVAGLLGATVFAVAALAGTRFQEPWIVAATTLAVAAAFNPLRRRIQAAVDRRFNRSRYDAERVADEFAGTLRDQVDPDGIVDGWVGVVEETMQPSALGVWVRM
jgi:hypothetical protein